jgi:rare lipoprotein A
MMRLHYQPWVLIAAASLVLSACSGLGPQRQRAPSPTPSPGTPGAAPPAAFGTPSARPQDVPDAVPRFEPRSRNGNPPFYEVYGKRYYVLSSASGYRERGVASWYGPGFHAIRTSTGEPYDMYGMSAAHKTLPLPAYVRVTNLQNGRSTVVRVNDRGPFVGNRIIDLSFSAAAKLDMLRNGTAMVEVRVLDPGVPEPLAVQNSPATSAASPESPVSSSALFVQAGAFADANNAERLAAKLRGGGYGTVFVRDNKIAGRKMYRVRIGPVPDVAEFDRVVAALERAGVRDAHLALD